MTRDGVCTKGFRVAGGIPIGWKIRERLLP